MKFRYFQDPGHGWVKVPKQLLAKLEIQHLITPYSYERGGFAYLEEDGDLERFMWAMEQAGETVDYYPQHTNRQSKIRSYDAYGTAAREQQYVAQAAL